MQFLEKYLLDYPKEIIQEAGFTQVMPKLRTLSDSEVIAVFKADDECNTTHKAFAKIQTCNLAQQSFLVYDLSYAEILDLAKTCQRQKIVILQRKAEVICCSLIDVNNCSISIEKQFAIDAISDIAITMSDLCADMLGNLTSYYYLESLRHYPTFVLSAVLKPGCNVLNRYDESIGRAYPPHARQKRKEFWQRIEEIEQNRYRSMSEEKRKRLGITEKNGFFYRKGSLSFASLCVSRMSEDK